MTNQENTADILTVQIEKKGRLDKVLADELADISRSQIQLLISQGRVEVNGEICELNKYKVTPGDTVCIELLEPEVVSMTPEDIPLDIIYEDSDLAVVNKPSGMVVHPAPGHASGTLVNALLYHLDDLSGINGELRPGIVHRLDKDTSGGLVIAKNDRAHQFLSEQLKDRSMKRVYMALVHGAFPNESGTIDAPLGRDAHDRKKYTVDKDGKEAITHFRVIENIGEYALVLAQLETGRTHQIRVHFKYIGHPVVGDEVYGPSNTLKGFGQYLHAYQLGFIHPTTKEYMEFTADLPAEFQKKIDELRGKYSRK